MTELERKIYQAIAGSNGLKGAEIANIINEEKQVVNSILAHSEELKALISQDKNYCWSLKQKTALENGQYETWEDDDYYMTPRLAAFFETKLNGRVVRCQVFPAKQNHNICRAAVELDNGNAYAIVEGIMGPRIFQLEAYADDSNSCFVCDDYGWSWKWKETGKPVEMRNLGGVEW